MKWILSEKVVLSDVLHWKIERLLGWMSPDFRSRWVDKITVDGHADKNVFQELCNHLVCIVHYKTGSSSAWPIAWEWRLNRATISRRKDQIEGEHDGEPLFWLKTKKMNLAINYPQNTSDLPLRCIELDFDPFLGNGSRSGMTRVAWPLPHALQCRT
jgi:hypothetical protein